MDRILGRIDKTQGCWYWSGQLDRNGYGRLSGKLAHRLVYQVLVGEIPEGLVLDHLCRVPRCVNPAHLEPVTPRENTLRGDTFAAFHAKKTHCKNGHGLSPDNTWHPKDRPYWRKCLICKRANWRKLYYQKKLRVTT